MELARHDIDGYLDQATNFRGPWLIVLPDGMVPLKRPALTPNEWDTYREHYGSAGKASIISGKPERDRQGGPGPNNDQAKS